MRNLYYIARFLEKLSKPTSSGSSILLYPKIQEIFSYIKPKNILEFGFHCGHSASLFLFAMNGCGTVYTCDPCNPKWVTAKKALDSVDLIKEEFGDNSIHFYQNFSCEDEFVKRITNIPFDFCFIDGVHEGQGPAIDLATAIKLGIKYILMDDYSFNNTNTVPHSIHNI